MRRRLIALALVGGLLAACGTDRSSAQPGDTSGPVGTAATTGVPESLQFSAPLVGGGSVDFSRFSGQTVALWFWAPT